MQRISIITLNLWNTECWDVRKDCVSSFVQTFNSDIYCFQEIRPELLLLLDAALPSYQRIEGQEEGWRCENTIYVKKDMFNVQEFGYFDLQMPEPLRGLFWAKLEAMDGKSLFVSTMHLTHQLNADEKRTGYSYRDAEARKVAQHLSDLRGSDASIVCGDFNDPIHPSRILYENAGFMDVFALLGIPAPVTFPCPYLSPETYLVEAIDKIMVAGNIKVVLASSPHYSLPAKALSDHWPVAAVLEL